MSEVKRKKQNHPMVEKKCMQCGETFISYYSQKRKFCCVPCLREYQRIHKGRVGRVCVACGKHFSVYVADMIREPDSGKYCCFECAHPIKKVTVACLVCGSEIVAAPSRIKSGRAKFCSKSCAMKHKSEKSNTQQVLKTCPVCGKKFWVLRYLKDKQRCCSRKCGKTGKANPQWIGGHTIKYPTAWTRKLRHSIRDRDNFTCVLCGEKAIDVHHIDYNKNNCEERNLISLCHGCHTKTNTNRGDWIVKFTELIENIYSRKENAA